MRDPAQNPDDAVIIRAIIQLGHNLRLEVIAEGTETLGAGGLPAPRRLHRRPGLPVQPPAAGRAIPAPAAGGQPLTR